MHRPERHRADKGRRQQAPRGRDGHQRRDRQVQAAEQRRDEVRARHHAPLHHHPIEEQVQRGQHREQREHHHEPLIARVERRRPPVEGQQEEQHRLIQVLQHVGDDQEAQLLSPRPQLLLVARPDEAKAGQQDHPDRHQRQHQPARPLVAALGEEHHEHTKGQRVERVQPPQLVVMPVKERRDRPRLARRRPTPVEGGQPVRGGGQILPRRGIRRAARCLGHCGTLQGQSGRRQSIGGGLRAARKS